MLGLVAVLNRAVRCKGPEVGVGQCGYSSLGGWREEGRIFPHGGGYQRRVISLLRRHLEMSGDIFGCPI